MFGYGFRRKVAALEAEYRQANPARRRKIASELHVACGERKKDAPQAVPFLEILLRDADPEVGEAAIYAMGHCGEPARERLLHLIEDSSALVRERAVSSHRALLLESVKDPDPEVRWSACYAIQAAGARGTDAIPVLLEQLSAESEERTRREIAGTLFWAAKGQDLSPHLPRMIEIARSSPASRPTIFSLCSTLGTRAAALMPMIRESLVGDDPAAAISALRDISGSDAEVIPALMELMESAPLQQRLWAAKQLLPLTGVTAEMVAVLEWALTQSPDEPAGFITEVGPSLAAMAAPLAHAIDENFAESDWDVMWALTDALAAIESVDAMAIAALRKALTHPSGIVKESALRGLAAAGRAASAALPDLRAMLKDSDAESSRRIRDVIRAIGKPGH